MFTGFGDFDKTLTTFDELRRRMDRLWSEFDGSWDDPRWPSTSLASSTWPLVNLYDAGANLVVKADVPGVSEKDLQIHISNGTLSIGGERKSVVPEGYTAHRQERGEVKFLRSFSVPSKVDAERITATIKDGVLTVTMPKAPEAQPRQITVQAQ
ncbi:Hsp20/alpha crystallin family protein [Pendulispora brunnea]|uniref:Hsp20/alpha crystallin family protein n=1 Tax=Pendulispora brunnea TaxID=2905690 RepID=A0ABZ2K073_9BACT